ncbi:MAG: hypothetical protein M3291_08285 [Actinomycetota bacterium]|nr:hypothetical protein [Actinomycetota bacterium]
MTGPGLLVIDNCAHLLDAVGDTVRRRAVLVPELSVLATSREPFGLAQPEASFGRRRCNPVEGDRHGWDLVLGGQLVALRDGRRCWLDFKPRRRSSRTCREVL